MSPQALSSVLSRTRRHLALVRLGDAAFVAVAAAGGVAAVALPFGLGSVFPVIAGLIGFFAMWRPGPSLADTAAWLDRRHGLHDLLASAWATRGRTGDWPATLHAIADATAAGLPLPGRIARFSPRHHACVLAGGVAVVLASRLMSLESIENNPADGAPSRIAISDRPDAAARQQTAAEVTRAPDTADSPTPLPNPAPTAPAANLSPRPRGPGDTANGPGRSDSDRQTAAPTPPSIDRQPPAAPIDRPGPAGSGRPAATADARGPAGGRVEAESSDQLNDGLAPRQNGPTATPTGNTQARPVPAGYRDLVRDYFAR